jgi:hypothetical protein
MPQHLQGARATHLTQPADDFTKKRNKGDTMKLTIHTSGPELTNKLVYNEKLKFDVIPELRWLHPRARMNQLVALMEKGEDTTILSWDELTMLIALGAARKCMAEVEVHYHFDDGKITVIKADRNGSLPSWPDQDGFFTERREVLFEKDLFEAKEEKTIGNPFDNLVLPPADKEN